MAWTVPVSSVSSGTDFRAHFSTPSPGVRSRPYGSAPNPGAPGTWNREVWWALNRSARIGQAPGNSRYRTIPPFRTADGLFVTAGEPRKPYGRSTHGRAYLTHLPHTMLFAWKRGVLAGRMMAWHCGSRTAYFRLTDEPDSPICPMCVFQAGRHSCP